jgi:uncharacterized protein
MNIDPVLLDILACPCEHHAPLEAVEGTAPTVPTVAAGAGASSGDGTLVCTRCRTSFPVRDDIPIMLLDEATPGPNGVGSPVTDPA